MPAKTVMSTPAILQLVADPQRWQLLTELALSDRRVGELCDLVGKPQNLVSYHVGQLRDAGLVTSRRSSADGRDTYYRADLTRCRDVFATASAALHPGVRLEPAHPQAFARSRGRTPRVLFLCTGNSTRSQIAEALLEHRSGHTISARSAGSHPKPLHPHAIRVMAERGIDISTRTSRHLQRFARSRFDHVVTLCDKVREICPEFSGRPAASHWSMADPSLAVEGADATYAAFVRTADEIETRIEHLIAQINHRTTTRKEPS